MDSFECHGHIFMDGMDYRQAAGQHRGGVDREIIRARFSELQSWGIGYYRDGGDRLGVSAFAREIAEEYGIEYKTCLFGIHKRGCYGGIVGFPFSDITEFRTLVKKAEDEHADFIKLMVSGIMDFITPGGVTPGAIEASELKELVHIAHDSGFAVMSHVNGDEHVRAAAEAGIDSIEHGYFVTEATVRTMKDAGTVWVPTLAATAGFVGRSGFTPGAAEENVRMQGKMLRYAQSVGVRIAAGSDAGAFGVDPARGIHMEHGLLAAAGIDAEYIFAGDREIRRRFRREI